MERLYSNIVIFSHFLHRFCFMKYYIGIYSNMCIGHACISNPSLHFSRFSTVLFSDKIADIEIMNEWLSSDEEDSENFAPINPLRKEYTT